MEFNLDERSVRDRQKKVSHYENGLLINWVMQISRGKIATPKNAALILFGVAIFGFLLSLFIVISGRPDKTEKAQRGIESHSNLRKPF